MKGLSIKALGQLLGQSINSNIIIAGYAIDSRGIQPGALFFALPGKKVDGHFFLKEAAAKQASAAIVSRDYKGDAFGLILIFVENVQEALHLLAKKLFSARKEKVIGVTGSVGKTTTKELIAHLLGAKYRVFKTFGSFNSQLTFPLTLLNLEGEFDFLVLEMGMSQPGEIEKLVDIAPPAIAIITRIAYAHAQFFTSGLSGIAAAKAEIFSHPQTTLAVLSRQAAEFEEVRRAVKCKKVTYSLDGPADYVLKEILTSPLSLPFFATHLQENFLAAYAVCRELGMKTEDIFARAQSWKNCPLRFELIQKEGITYVQDCYNANPESMRAALLNLPDPEANGKKIAVLGSMKELGTFSEDCHKQIGELALTCVDRLFCLGPECQTMIELFIKAGKKAEIFPNLLDLKKNVENSVRKGDVVLIKGSNAHQLWKLLED